MKTVMKIGRYELQADSFNNCQLFDTATGNISMRMDRFTLAGFRSETDTEIKTFAESIFAQPYYSGVSDAEMEVFNKQP